MAYNDSFNYFLAHQDELYQKYPEQYLVLVGDFLASVQPTLDMAVLSVVSRHLQPGTYLIQQCGPDQSCYAIHTSHRISHGIKGTI